MSSRFNRSYSTLNPDRHTDACPPIHILMGENFNALFDTLHFTILMKDDQKLNGQVAWTKVCSVVDWCDQINAMNLFTLYCATQVQQI